MFSCEVLDYSVWNPVYSRIFIISKRDLFSLILRDSDSDYNEILVLADWCMKRDDDWYLLKEFYRELAYLRNTELEFRNLRA